MIKVVKSQVLHCVESEVCPSISVWSLNQGPCVIQMIQCV